MGPFDKEVNNSLDGMFDLNGDGFLSSSEEAMKYDFLNSFDDSVKDDSDISFGIDDNYGDFD